MNSPQRSLYAVKVLPLFHQVRAIGDDNAWLDPAGTVLVVRYLPFPLDDLRNLLRALHAVEIQFETRRRVIRKIGRKRDRVLLVAAPVGQQSECQRIVRFERLGVYRVDVEIPGLLKTTEALSRSFLRSADGVSPS